MDTSINIGRTIARERRRRGLTQEALAEHLGVSKAAVSKWELAQSLPDVALLPRIAAYFSLSLDELFDYRAQLSEAESAALYAQVYAEAERDLPAAHAHLRQLTAEHYADADLLVLFASLLTMWAAGQASPFAPGAARADATCDMAGDGLTLAEEVSTDGMPAADDLRAGALELLDHVIEEASDPAIAFYAQQQKATTLYQAGKFEDAIALLEPLTRRHDTGTATMLLASAYRRTGCEEDAWRLLQSQQLQAAGFILSSFEQEVGMTENAGFAQRAAAAGLAMYEMLGMEAISPYYAVTMTLELADALRRAGEADSAFDELSRVLDMVEHSASVNGAAAHAMPLFDHVAAQLDPTNVGEDWAAHKARQADGMHALMRRAVAERIADPAWRDIAGADPRYRELIYRACKLA